MTLTMEEAARLCGLPKLPTPLITREPCESCKDADTEADTGAFRCRVSMHGDPQCLHYRDVREQEDIARQCAALFKRIGDHKMRYEWAYGTADGFANALHEQGRGAEFDTDAFMDLCGWMEDR